MDSARALAALDELPEATVVLVPVRDDTGALVDFVFDYANRLACSIVGGPAAEPLRGRRLLTALPDFSPKLLRRFAAVLD
ncbi:MAG TPA: hypothetical protein VGV67_04785, partial [Solirubrobacteraceae bacterium]|nr:hypothetical protein [Solirubrobacteraceae bacterium]